MTVCTVARALTAPREPDRRRPTGRRPDRSRRPQWPKARFHCSPAGPRRTTRVDLHLAERAAPGTEPNVDQAAGRIGVHLGLGRPAILVMGAVVGAVDADILPPVLQLDAEQPHQTAAVGDAVRGGWSLRRCCSAGRACRWPRRSRHCLPLLSTEAGDRPGWERCRKQDPAAGPAPRVGGGPPPQAAFTAFRKVSTCVLRVTDR